MPGGAATAALRPAHARPETAGAFGVTAGAIGV
jgi:hypothetical protein